MLKRLIVGLAIGLVMGSLVAALVIKVLGVSVFGSTLAYLFAAVTGLVTGLVAGKPIWAAGGQIEAGLKAAFGAIVSVGVMYALRRWLPMQVDLTALHPAIGAGTIGELPAISLPVIAALLGAFYSADNTPGESADEAPKGKRIVESAGKGGAPGRSRVAARDADDLDLDGDASASRRAKR